MFYGRPMGLQAYSVLSFSPTVVILTIIRLLLKRYKRKKKLSAFILHSVYDFQMT